MIGVLGSLAEYERELVRERTALKRQTSRANGTRFGRPRKVPDVMHMAVVNAPHLVALVRAGAVFHKGKLLELPVDIGPDPGRAANAAAETDVA